MFIPHRRQCFPRGLVNSSASESLRRAAILPVLKKAKTPPAVDLLLRSVGSKDRLTTGCWSGGMSGNRFPPELELFSRAPTANPLLDVGCEIPLVAFSSSLGRRQDGLGDKEEKSPAIFRADVAGDALGDFGEKETPVAFSLEWDMNESRHTRS